MKHLLSFATVAVLGMGLAGIAEAACGPYEVSLKANCCYANHPIPVGKTLSQAGKTVRCVGPNAKSSVAHFVRYSNAAGIWQAAFTGSDQGFCRVRVMASGRLAGTCRGRNEGYQAFLIGGLIKGSRVQFGITDTGANFRGTIHGSIGRGTWENAGNSGKWVMRKRP